MLCKNCGNELNNEEKFCSKCGTNISNNLRNNNKSYIRYFIGISAIILVVVVVIGLGKAKEVQIPNLIGMTIEQAQCELEKIDLRLKIENLSSNNIITSQKPNYSENYKIKKGSTINISTLTKDDIDKQNEEKRKKEEEEITIKETIKKWAENVRNYNQGSVSYKSHRDYNTSNDERTIYLIVYDTGSKYSEYRQLVEIEKKDLTKIKQTTKLYLFTYVSDGVAGSNQEKEMEWEAEKLWGI